VVIGDVAGSGLPTAVSMGRAAIRRGLSSEDAAVEAGVSPAVGTRWFREAGGMPPTTQVPVSGRYLSFAGREEIAMLRAWLRRAGDRPASRPFG